MRKTDGNARVLTTASRIKLSANYKNVINWDSMRPKNKFESQGEVCNTVVRPAMMYGAETWAVKKAQENKLDVAEMESPCWTELGMKELDGQGRWEKYPRKCRKVG